MLGIPLTAEEEDADLLLLILLARPARDLARSFRSASYAAHGQRNTNFAYKWFGDDKVEHARDGAIKLVAGQADAIAFN
jgi:hypothetical protein